MATRNRYAEIMAQYQQAQPFSFFGYPQAYTGGYDITQPQVSAPVNRYEEIMAQPARAGGGWLPAEQRAEREAAYNAPQDYLSIDRYDPITGTNVKDVMSAAQLAALSPAERAMHMADVRQINPFRTFISDVATKTGILPVVNSMYENFMYGNLGKPLAPGVPKAPVMDVFPGEFSFVNGGAISTPDTQAVQTAINNTDFSGMDRGGSSGGGGGGGYSGAPSGGSDVGRSAPGSAHYAQGGHVAMQHLLGPNPDGPDDGYGALKDGEFVINDKAVKKYGIELMQAINSGKISKGKLRGLLEM